ncbi:MAG: hypothetical protein H6558_00630 [Lewinellaceae bacterium]|nr:hypothetical protein [Lewinellaceae bacterium]
MPTTSVEPPVVFAEPGVHTLMYIPMADTCSGGEDRCLHSASKSANGSTANPQDTSSRAQFYA